MIVSFNNIISSKEELMNVDRTNPYNVVTALIHVFCNYDNNDNNKFFDLLQYLMGEYQPISNLMKQNVIDRMTQNDKYLYIGKSYFIGSTPDNEYTPNIPYQVEVKENDYTDSEQGYKRLLVKSGGSDNDRIVTVRLAKDGNYYIWSDSFMGLLADIRKPESTNPWA